MSNFNREDPTESYNISSQSVKNAKEKKIMMKSVNSLK